MGMSSLAAMRGIETAIGTTGPALTPRMGDLLYPIWGITSPGRAPRRPRRGRRLDLRRAAVPLPVDDHDLDRAGDRDRAERAEDAGDLGADEHRDQHRERRELHRSAVDERLEHVVLELLVDDEEHDHDDPGRDRVQEGDACRR